MFVLFYLPHFEEVWVSQTMLFLQNKSSVVWKLQNDYLFIEILRNFLNTFLFEFSS